MSQTKYAKDGRRILDPPCKFGHTRQAMECPSCGELIVGESASEEHWQWYLRRYNKQDPR